MPLPTVAPVATAPDHNRGRRAPDSHQSILNDQVSSMRDQILATLTSLTSSVLFHVDESDDAGFRRTSSTNSYLKDNYRRMFRKALDAADLNPTDHGFRVTYEIIGERRATGEWTAPGFRAWVMSKEAVLTPDTGEE